MTISTLPTPAERPINDQLARALNPGDRDLILVTRGTVVAAKLRIEELEREVSRLKGTLAMTHPKNPLEVGDLAVVNYRQEAHPNKVGTVIALGKDDLGEYAELEFADDESEEFALTDLSKAAA
jgi:hypothetical protein